MPERRVLTSLIGYYAGYRVGGAAGEGFARVFVDAYESNGAMSGQTIDERYRAIVSKIEADTARWQPLMVIASLPIEFALEPMFKPITRGWNDQAHTHELSYSQWKMRMYGLILLEDVLNSVCFGLLVYLGLHIARRSSVD